MSGEIAGSSNYNFKANVIGENVSVPPLKEMSTVSIVSTIYKQKDTIDIINQSDEKGEEETLKEVQQLVRQKLQLLPLPNSVMKILLDFYKLLTHEGHLVFGCNRFSSNRSCDCNYVFSIPTEYFNCLCFNTDGTVNEVKTLNIMMQTNYPAYKIFVAASHLCCKELVFESWNKLVLDFHHHTNRLNIFNQIQKQHELRDCELNSYWVYLVNNKLRELPGVFRTGNFEITLYPRRYTLIERMFHSSFDRFNVHAIKYFFHKLTDDQKSSKIETLVDKLLERSEYSELFGHDEFKSDSCNKTLPKLDIAFFLISQVKEKEEKIKMLKKYLSSLIFPLVSNLLYRKWLKPVLSGVWDSLDQPDYNLVNTIVLKLVVSDCRMAKDVFVDLWSGIPKRFKISFGYYFCAQGNRTIDFGYDLFKHLDILKLILSECTEKEKEKYLYSNSLQSILRNLFRDDRKYKKVVNEFLNELFSSKSDISKLKRFLGCDDHDYFSQPTTFDSLLDSARMQERNCYGSDYSFLPLSDIEGRDRMMELFDK